MDFFAFLKRNRKKTKTNAGGKKELARSKFFRLGIERLEDRTLLSTVFDDFTGYTAVPSLNGQTGGDGDWNGAWQAASGQISIATTGLGTAGSVTSAAPFVQMQVLPNTTVTASRSLLPVRSEEHTSELQSRGLISYA